MNTKWLYIGAAFSIMIVLVAVKNDNQTTDNPHTSQSKASQQEITHFDSSYRASESITGLDDEPDRASENNIDTNSSDIISRTSDNNIETSERLDEFDNLVSDNTGSTGYNNDAFPTDIESDFYTRENENKAIEQEMQNERELIEQINPVTEVSDIVVSEIDIVSETIQLEKDIENEQHSWSEHASIETIDQQLPPMETH